MQRRKGGVYGITGAGVMMRTLENHNNNNTPLDYCLIKHTKLRDVNIKREGGSYNDGNQHWSIRQKSESLYVDGSGPNL